MLKKLVSVIIVFAILFSALSCAPRSDSPPSENQELTLYLDAYTKDYMNLLIEQFSKKHPSVKIHIEDYSSLTIPDYRTKIAGELMSGGGPDIMLVSNASYGNTLENLTKLLQNGKLLDLNTLQINTENCFEQVLKAGEYNGGQFLMPLNFNLGFLLTSQERVAEYSLKINDGLKAFSRSLESVYAQDKYAFVDYFKTDYLYPQHGIQMIDYANNALIDTAENRATLKIWAEAFDRLFPNIMNGSYDKYNFLKYWGKYDYSLDKAFVSGDLMFIGARAFNGTYSNLSSLNSMAKAIANSGETPLLLTMPTSSGENTAPNVNFYLVANANTKSTEAVTSFINTALGEDAQHVLAAQTGIPNNKIVVDYMKKFYSGESVPEKYQYFPDSYMFSDALLQTFFYAIDNMKDGVYIDANISNRLFFLVKSYILQEKDFESAFDDCKQAIRIYLTE